MGDFCQLLCDLNEFAKDKITLNVIDAVVGMDGEGPTNGKPKFMGKILASANPYALDVVAVKLFGEPFEMPLIKTAVERGRIKDDLSDIDFDFEEWKSSFISDFNISPITDTNTFLHMPDWVKKLARKYLTKKVRMEKSICKGCGKCATHCPAKAITVIKGKAKVKQKKCIRCYCCQELCPFDAVKFRKPLAYRVVHAFSRTKKRK